MKINSSIKLCLLAVLFLTIPNVVSNARADLKIGAAAPQELLFKTADGKETNLAEFKGKTVVLEWLNAECPYVKKHYSVSNMQALQKEYTDKGVIWLTVNSSAPGKQGALDETSAAAFVKSSSSSQTAVVLDSSGALGRAFGAKTTPHMFVVDGLGKLAYEGAIDDNDSARSATIVGAKNYVKLAVDEILAGKPVTIAQTEAYGCSVKYAS